MGRAYVEASSDALYIRKPCGTVDVGQMSFGIAGHEARIEAGVGWKEQLTTRQCDSVLCVCLLLPLLPLLCYLRRAIPNKPSQGLNPGDGLG